MYVCMYRCTDQTRRLVQQTDGWTGGRMDGRTDEPMKKYLGNAKSI